MAEQISMVEWLESLAVCGEDVTFDFQVVGILSDGRVRVRAIIRAGAVDLWKGDEDILCEDGRLSLSGFRLRGNDLVLEDFGEHI